MMNPPSTSSSTSTSTFSTAVTELKSQPTNPNQPPSTTTAAATTATPTDPDPQIPTTKLTSRPRKLRRISPETTTPTPSPPPTRALRIIPRPLSSHGEIETALRHLRNADPHLSRLIQLHHAPTFDSFQPPFLALTKSILYQQLAYKAGTSIYSRFVSLCGGESTVLPDTILSLTPQQLRQIGVSSRKCSYLHDLARKYQNGILSDSSILNMDDKSLFTMLTMVNGIGSWSVHMFMIFSLHRPDVLPVNDLGVRKGVQLLYGLDDLPRPSQMEQLCEKWRPYRSVASWYLWRFVEAKGTPSALAVVNASTGLSLQQQEPHQSQIQPHQQLHHQHQGQFHDPINAIINIGRLS